MTVKIAIIGLGQIGASIGLALASHKDQVSTIGFDSSHEVQKSAQKLGAVESTGHNLPGTVKDADVIVLAIPLDQVQETLQTIAAHIKKGSILIETAPAKLAVEAWVEEVFGDQCQYVGLTPAVNFSAMGEGGKGIASARADLFQNGLVAVTASHWANENTIKLVTSFVTLLGARPYFADLAEVDGIMATIHTLPALVAAALSETVFGQPGWSDIRKLTGRIFAAAMHPLEGEDSAALSEAAKQNRDNTVRVLDDLIGTLKSLRDEINGSEKDSLKGRLANNQAKREQWQRVRSDGDWESIESVEQEIPSFSDLWMQQLGLGKLIGLGNRKNKKD
jgi:prephenate dehydrogenase